MSKTVWRITPVNGCDIPGLEHWLEKQAQKGLMFYMTLGTFTLFHRAEPTALRFHLEPAPNKPNRIDPELNTLYEQAGWRYLGLFRSSFAVFATEHLDTQAHTDPEIWDYVLKRFFRREILAGSVLLALNFFFLSLYWYCIRSFPWFDLRWFPMEVLSRQPVIASALSVIGLAFVDLSWLMGLYALQQYRKSISGRQTPLWHSHGGGLLAAGTLILILVLADAFWPAAGLNHWIDPASDFVTLADIEGDIPDYQISEQTRHFYSYGYNHGSLFRPKNWSFYQAGRHRWVNGAADTSVPSLKLQLYRYPLPLLAEWMAEEQSRIQWNGGVYEAASSLQELDQVFISHDRFDPEQDTYPTIRFLLRRGRDVILVEYRGEQDLTQFLPRFAEMLDRL